MHRIPETGVFCRAVPPRGTALLRLAVFEYRLISQSSGLARALTCLSYGIYPIQLDKIEKLPERRPKGSNPLQQSAECVSETKIIARPLAPQEVRGDPDTRLAPQ